MSYLNEIPIILIFFFVSKTINMIPIEMTDNDFEEQRVHIFQINIYNKIYNRI